MCEKWSDRTEKLIGSDALEILKKSKVAVFGLGGVGSFTAEALVRAGVGNIAIVDHDTVNITNINRQLIALKSTVGRQKTEVLAKRLKDINEDVEVDIFDFFFLPENSSKIEFKGFDYVCDCVDTVTAKLEIIRKAKEADVPVISCMGTGNKLNPSLFEITDIEKTSVCPLAKVMRKECKDRDYRNVKVLYSKEQPVNVGDRTPASISFVPSVAGLMIAGEVINDLIKRG